MLTSGSLQFLLLVLAVSLTLVASQLEVPSDTSLIENSTTTTSSLFTNLSSCWQEHAQDEDLFYYGTYQLIIQVTGTPFNQTQVAEDISDKFEGHKEESLIASLDGFSPGILDVNCELVKLEPLTVFDFETIEYDEDGTTEVSTARQAFFSLDYVISYDSDTLPGICVHEFYLEIFRQTPYLEELVVKLYTWLWPSDPLESIGSDSAVSIITLQDWDLPESDFAAGNYEMSFDATGSQDNIFTNFENTTALCAILKDFSKGTLGSENSTATDCSAHLVQVRPLALPDVSLISALVHRLSFAVEMRWISTTLDSNLTAYPDLFEDLVLQDQGILIGQTETAYNVTDIQNFYFAQSLTPPTTGTTAPSAMSTPPNSTNAPSAVPTVESTITDIPVETESPSEAPTGSPDESNSKVVVPIVIAVVIVLFAAVFIMYYMRRKSATEESKSNLSPSSAAVPTGTVEEAMQSSLIPTSIAVSTAAVEEVPEEATTIPVISGSQLTVEDKALPSDSSISLHEDSVATSGMELHDSNPSIDNNASLFAMPAMTVIDLEEGPTSLIPGNDTQLEMYLQQDPFLEQFRKSIESTVPSLKKTFHQAMLTRALSMNSSDISTASDDVEHISGSTFEANALWVITEWLKRSPEDRPEFQT